MRLDDDAIRVAIDFRLGTNLCEAHAAKMLTLEARMALHADATYSECFRVVRHHNINDLLCRAFTRAGIKTAKEPSGLFVADGKRPDEMTSHGLMENLKENLTWKINMENLSHVT